MRSTSTLFVVLALFVADLAAQGQDRLEEAQRLHVAGRMREALAAYRDFTAAGTGDPADLAAAHNNACLILCDFGDYPAALEEGTKALALRRELGDEDRLSTALNNLGRALRGVGRYDEAEIAYFEALAINERHGDAAGQALNHMNLGVVARSQGRYTETMRRYAAAEELARAHLDEPWAARRLAVVRINQGAVLERLGAYREALDLYRGMAEETEGLNARRRATVEVNLGTIYRNLGDPVRAVAAYEAAAELYTQLDDVAGLSNARLNLALARHLNLGLLDEAEADYRAALELARRSGDRSEEIQDLYYLGDLELDLGRLDDAAASFDECLALAGDSGSAEGRWSALYGLGRVAERRGEARAALASFRAAIEEIEDVRASLEEGARRAGYFGDKRPVYGAAVRVLASLAGEEPGAGHGERALEIVQRAKARALVDALLDAPEPLTAGELLGLVRPGTVLLEYFRAGDELYLWELSAGAVRMSGLGPARPILERTAELHRALAAGGEPPPETVAELSRTLLGPASLAGASALRIAPDGPLHYLPFEILEDPAAPGAPLVERHTVSYLPSASTLALAGRRAHGDPDDMRQLVGFADPRLPGTADGSVPASSVPASLLVERFGLEALPAAAGELAAVARLLGGEQEIAIGAAASESAFRRAVRRPVRVVHLATHTVADERFGRGAAVLLAAGGDDDGVLRPEEIAALDYGGELTVLASCRSALGTDGGGGAFSSLTGSFLAAGSSAVVATLWDVDDAATAAFMEQLYHQLSRGRPVAEALRRTKLRLRAHPGWDHPSIWAAYVLVGDGELAVRASGVAVWLWGVTAALAILAGALAARRLRRSRQGRS